MNLMRLVYSSRSRLVEANRRQEIDRMVASAQRLNAMNNVTGFLLVTENAFAQVLEGEAQSVAETYGRIVVDPRHTAIRLLAEEPITALSFQNWSMGFAEQDETTQVIFGLYGVTPENDLWAQPPDLLIDLAGEFANQRA